MDQSNVIVALKQFETIRKYNFMRVRNGVGRIESQLRFIVSAPCINCGVVLILQVTFLQLNHESLLNFDVDDTENIFHVFFIHFEEYFSSNFF